MDYYKLLTDDISRNEESTWKFLAFYAASFAFFISAIAGKLAPFVPVLAITLLTTWALHILINGNMWARRSHLMAANVEQEFFVSTDLDVLLPRFYYEIAGSYRYRRIFRTHITVFFAVLLFSLSYELFSFRDTLERSVLLLPRIVVHFNEVLLILITLSVAATTWFWRCIFDLFGIRPTTRPRFRICDLVIALICGFGVLVLFMVQSPERVERSQLSFTFFFAIECLWTLFLEDRNCASEYADLVLHAPGRQKLIPPPPVAPPTPPLPAHPPSAPSATSGAPTDATKSKPTPRSDLH